MRRPNHCGRKPGRLPGKAQVAVAYRMAALTGLASPLKFVKNRKDKKKNKRDIKQNKQTKSATTHPGCPPPSSHHLDKCFLFEFIPVYP